MKILLLSDAPMCANGGGISQTLYNVFSFIEVENILCIAPAWQLLASPPTEPFSSRYITYRFEIIKSPKNRLGKFITPFADWFNYSFNQLFRRFSKIKKQIIAFNPDVVVSCSHGPVGVFMHFKLLNGLKIKKIIPYFMDDWMYQLKLKWVGGDIHNSIRKLLAANKSWLMISYELAKILEDKYKVTPGDLLELHNPVDLSNAPNVLPVVKKDTYTLAYAGALWPMHYDSFKVVAASVKQLSAKRNVNLILYSPVGFWTRYKEDLEPLNVSYGGSIPYKEIHEKLARADGLILVSSFRKEFYSHSKGSLQTKMTDYLKAKRLIISCGPEYSANHNFLKKHKCGVRIETNDVEAVAHQLDEILDHIEDHQQTVSNGWDLLVNEFTFSKVHKKFKEFVAKS
jgi:glycosyltransferase involved in cell wall biosynthesis